MKLKYWYMRTGNLHYTPAEATGWRQKMCRTSLPTQKLNSKVMRQHKTMLEIGKKFKSRILCVHASVFEIFVTLIRMSINLMFLSQWVSIALLRWKPMRREMRKKSMKDDITRWDGMLGWRFRFAVSSSAINFKTITN